jgi:signal transduction histidine kinase
MRLRTRLLLTFGLVTGVMLVPSLFAVSRLAQLGDIAVEERSGHAAAVASLGQMQALTADLDYLERSFIATRDSRLGDRARIRADSLQQVYARFLASPYGEVGADLGIVIADLVSLEHEVARHMSEGSTREATAAFERMLPRFGIAVRQYRVTADSIDAVAGAQLDRADAMSASARGQTWLAVAVALLLAPVFAGLTTHRLTSPLRRLGRATARVADGHFEAPGDLPYERGDEVGDLSMSFGIMTRKLAELDRTKSEFLGMVSHELKTPINVIGAYTEILRDELTDVSEAHGKMIEDVADQARAMARLVSRLMDLSRLEAGTYQLQFESVGLAHLMTDIASSFRRLAAEKGVTLGTRIAERVPAEAILDGDIIRDEVLGNLVLNAIRYTPSGGRIDVSLESDQGGIRFMVCDSGPGIPDEHRELIFRKHYVADRTRAVGSGLGLAIAKEMVELHGGMITLESAQPGCGGACFRVALPIVPASADVEVPAASLLGGSGPRKEPAVA